MSRRSVAAALTLLALSACAERPADVPPGQVRIAPGLVLTLPAPAELGRRLEVAQLVTARYRGSTFVFEGNLSATPERFLLVGLDPMGRKAMTVTWTMSGIVVETAPWLPAEVRPDNMLADIVLLYWPEASVRAALAPAGVLAVRPHSRTVSVGGKEVVHADYEGDDPWVGNVTYRNLAWDYTLTIQSAETAP